MASFTTASALWSNIPQLEPNSPSFGPDKCISQELRWLPRDDAHSQLRLLERLTGLVDGTGCLLDPIAWNVRLRGLVPSPPPTPLLGQTSDGGRRPRTTVSRNKTTPAASRNVLTLFFTSDGNPPTPHAWKAWDRPPTTRRALPPRQLWEPGPSCVCQLQGVRRLLLPFVHLGRGAIRPPQLEPPCVKLVHDAEVQVSHKDIGSDPPTSLAVDSCGVFQSPPRPNVNSTCRPVMAKGVERTATSTDTGCEGEWEAQIGGGTRPSGFVVPNMTHEPTNGAEANGPPWDLRSAPSALDKVGLKLARKDDSTA